MANARTTKEAWLAFMRLNAPRLLYNMREAIEVGDMDAYEHEAKRLERLIEAGRNLEV